MEGKEMTYEETTVQQLSGKSVGIADVMMDDVPDEKNVVARRPVATLAILEYDSDKKNVHEIVTIGSVVSIGGDRYCITNIVIGDGERAGTVSLRKVTP